MFEVIPIVLIILASSYVTGAKILRLPLEWNKGLKKSSAAIFGGLMLMNPTGVMATADDTKVYVNERYHTELRYPADWIEATGQLSGDRSLVAFVDPSDKDTSASIVFTPIPADYTRLNSFGGGQETIRQYLLPKGDGIETNVLKEYAKGDSYYLEYVVQAQSNPVRHVISVFALRPQESIVGLTVQSLEENYSAKKSTLDKIAPTLRTDLQ